MNESTLECERCGAPLSYAGQAVSVACSFCGAVTMVERQPEPVMPSTATPGAAATSASASKAQAVVAALVIGSIVVSIATYAALSAVSTPGGKPSSSKASKGRTAMQVVQNPLTMTIDKMAQLYPDATRNESSLSNALRINLDDPTFDDITYAWDAGSPAHVTDISLSTARPAKALATWAAKLSPILGRQGEQTDATKYEYSWCGLRTVVDESGVRVFVSTLRTLNMGLGGAKIRWPEHLEQLWDVVKGAVFNAAPLNVNPSVRERLGELPFSRLARLNPQTDVDNSQRTVETVLPNTCPAIGSDVSYITAVDHHWFADVTLVWRNERNAKLINATFRPPNVNNGKLANQTAVARCVKGWLGTPVENEVNHMEKVWSYDWARQGRLSVHICDSYLWTEGPFSTADWQKLIQVLDACGR